jgi:L-lactate dehydrogenase complex protein LldG
VSARAAILERVRRARRTGKVPVEARTLVPVDRGPGSMTPNLEKFLSELSLVGVEQYVEVSAALVRGRVSALVAGRSVLCWDANRLPYDVGLVLSNTCIGTSPREEQAAAEIGVTGCDAAIAETGTLAMLSGPGKPRSASLLPPVHLCVVRLADVCFGMREFFEDRAADIAAAACCYFITGPSRTADIELTLTLGVHGPGKVIVVVGP